MTTTPTTLKADTSADAYNRCQCDDEWSAGRIIVVDDEQIVGLAWIWPIAVTAERGELHSAKRDPREWEGKDANPALAAAVADAIAIAKGKGWPLAGWADDTDADAFDNTMRQQFDDKAAGAIAMLRECSTYDTEGATAIPDPYHDGVWLVTMADGTKVVARLAGYGWPETHYNDFEEVGA